MRGSVWADALWGVRSRPLRSLSLALSLASAIACVVFSASVLGGFSQQIERLAFGDYPRTLVVRPNMLVDSRRGPPSLNQRTMLESELSGIESSAAWAEGIALVRSGSDQRNAAVYGALGDYRRELDAGLVAGRWLTTAETGGLTRVCLIGPDLADFLGREDLVGREIMLGAGRCEVVGVLDYTRSRPAGRFNNAAVAPFMTARRYFIDDDSAGPRSASWLSFFMEHGTDMDEAAYQADRLLRRSASVPLSRPSPYEYADPTAAVREQAQQRDLLARLLWTITAAALIASLIGYGGIAFGAAAQRRREIALRLAMGATPRRILHQITLEHIILGGGAAFAGLATGAAAALSASALWGWPVSLSLVAAGGAVVLGLALGAGLGSMAASKAARTSPALAAKG